MRYTLFLFLSITFLNLSAQQKQFPVDDRGKFIYYKVVDSQLIIKDSLMNRAKYFVNALNKASMKQEQLTDTSIFAKGTIVIDKSILVASHPSGEVNYNFVFEARNGKYRFWLTDFEFIPYQRNRYGNFVATTKIGTPLEKTPSKLRKGEWNDMVSSAYAKANKFADEFKKYLATNHMEKTKKKAATISTKNW